MQQLQTLPRMFMRQRIRPMVNQYEFRAAEPDGSEGALLAFAQQKRMAFKEEVTLYTDDSKQQPVLGFKARQVVDLGATYDVYDASGTPIGMFRKDFKQSLLRSTWHMEQAGMGPLQGQERNAVLGLVRRFVDAAQFIPYHFDFVADETPVFSIDKRWGVRDRYTIDIPDPRADRRMVIAMTVAVDALQAR